MAMLKRYTVDPTPVINHLERMKGQTVRSGSPVQILPEVLHVQDERMRIALLGVPGVIECNNRGEQTKDGGFFRLT